MTNDIVVENATHLVSTTPGEQHTLSGFAMTNPKAGHGRALLVALFDSNRSDSTLTYNGVSMSRVHNSSLGVSGLRRAAFFILKDSQLPTDTAAHDFVRDDGGGDPGSTNDITLAVLELSNVNQGGLANWMNPTSSVYQNTATDLTVTRAAREHGAPVFLFLGVDESRSMSAYPGTQLYSATGIGGVDRVHIARTTGPTPFASTGYTWTVDSTCLAAAMFMELQPSPIVPDNYLGSQVMQSGTRVTGSEVSESTTGGTTLSEVTGSNRVLLIHATRGYHVGTPGSRTDSDFPATINVGGQTISVQAESVNNISTEGGNDVQVAVYVALESQIAAMTFTAGEANWACTMAQADGLITRFTAHWFADMEQVVVDADSTTDDAVPMDVTLTATERDLLVCAHAGRGNSNTNSWDYTIDDGNTGAATATDAAAKTSLKRSRGLYPTDYLHAYPQPNNFGALVGVTLRPINPMKTVVGVTVVGDDA